MTLKPANIQQATPAKRGSRAGHNACDLASIGLHSGQHRFNGGRDGDAEGFTSATLGAGECKNPIFQIHAVERDLRLAEATARSQSDLKTDSHPFRHTFHSQRLPGNFNLIIRKHGFNSANRPSLNSVIQKGDRIHLAQQSALAVNPFKNFQILARLVSARLTARGAGEALAPLQINFTIAWRKRLQTDFFLTNKSRQMTPRVPVINFCQRRNGMIFNQIIDPITAAILSLFTYSDSGRFGRCLRAVKSIVDSVAGAFGAPLAGRIFKANKEPWGSFLNVRIGHGYNGNIYSV